ncbi:MAG TPA: helix-turn-helix domain-containing protein [Polyangia bacterium]|nr:helix-turn-helix domain-containing protein [Polyangia bacterium]
MSSEKVEGSARERLLAAANELFYQEGIHTVGIDRVIERAGVAKASLYSAFGSKDELVREYLRGRAAIRQQRISERIARAAEPRQRILAVFDLLGELATEPTFRGCAFVNARAEGPREATKVSRVCDDMRAWLRRLFTGLARDAGAAEPERLGGELVLLYDGATVGASMDHDPGRARVARAIASRLLDAAVSGDGRRRRVPARTGGS